MLQSGRTFLSTTVRLAASGGIGFSNFSMLADPVDSGPGFLFARDVYHSS